MVQAVAHYGAGWYQNRALWDTPDGVVPYRAFWPWWAGITVNRAWDRLDAAQAASLPHMDNRQRRQVVDDLTAAAFGG